VSTLDPHVGDVLRLVRSGHVAGSGEPAVVVAVHAGEKAFVVRVRWHDGRETFVPVGAATAEAGDASS